MKQTTLTVRLADLTPATRAALLKAIDDAWVAAHDLELRLAMSFGESTAPTRAALERRLRLSRATVAIRDFESSLP